MVNLIFIEDDDALAKRGVVCSLYDPTAGTAGLLRVAGEHLSDHNPGSRLVMFGQELNPESYAICKADMLIKGQNIGNIIFGNTLSADGLPGKRFDYMLSNPPFGVEWKKIEKEVRREAEQEGFNGRFGPGLPRVSDGSLLGEDHLAEVAVAPKSEGLSHLGCDAPATRAFPAPAAAHRAPVRHVANPIPKEPDAGIPHVRICGGPSGKPPGLPDHPSHMALSLRYPVNGYSPRSALTLRVSNGAVSTHAALACRARRDRWGDSRRSRRARPAPRGMTHGDVARR